MRYRASRWRNSPAARLAAIAHKINTTTMAINDGRRVVMPGDLLEAALRISSDLERLVDDGRDLFGDTVVRKLAYWNPPRVGRVGAVRQVTTRDAAQIVEDDEVVLNPVVGTPEYAIENVHERADLDLEPSLFLHLTP